jgi:hypothetical protein
MLARLSVVATMALASLGASLAVASAQYPPPVGNCVVIADATATDVGGSVNLTVTVRDLDGLTVAGEPVTLSVTNQPGSGATVQPTSATTDANGVVIADLNVGTTAGVVEITVTTAEVSCRASVSVQGGEVGGAVELPETGSGPVAGLGLEGFAALAFSAGSLLVGVGIRRRAG